MGNWDEHLKSVSEEKDEENEVKMERARLAIEAASKAILDTNHGSMRTKLEDNHREMAAQYEQRKRETDKEFQVAKKGTAV